ncbi:hypothetical protein F2Q70_00013668 [Brassica cretica]|uniref:Uncharacterized protein n=1 Tax=Brassica cretica TaxID=69181 RepID=A0A8S9M277_BRACR|nr:hypothetical protein F2Q70_00013668 [Brassica cretica]
MHFMLEDFPRSLQEVFRSLLPKVIFPDLRDFERLLRRLSEDSRKTSQKTLGRLLRSLLRKSSNAFYARRLPTKSSGSLQEVFRSLLPKVAPMNLPMYQTRYMVHAPLTLQLTSAHDSLALSTNVHKLLQLRSPLFLLNRCPIFALLHFGLIRNKYGRWYGPPVRTSPYFRTITQLSPNGV